MAAIRFTSLCLILTLATSVTRPLDAVETIAVDTSTTYQTIEAWGMAGGSPVYTKGPTQRSHLLRLIVDELGLTRTRVEAQHGSGQHGPNFELFNDDGDPTTGNPATFANTAKFDAHMTDFTVPFQQMVQSRGDTFSCYFSPSFYDSGSTGTAPKWILNSPGEAAEHLLGYLLRMKNVHGVTPTYTTILNEPGYHNSWTASIVTDVIHELGPRMRAAGLPTMIQFAEGFSPTTTWNRIQAAQNDPVVWPYIGMLSYHLYGGSVADKQNIRDFGIANGIPRAQTEFLHQNVDTLYGDLVDGGVSVWELYGWGNSYITQSDYWFSRKPGFWNVRQVTRYVHQGSVRVDAASTSASIRPLAFHRNGKSVVVLWNNSGGGATTANITGMAPGSYVVCHSSTGGSGRFFVDGKVTASAGGVISGLAVPTGIVTVYPDPGNQAPILTDWNSSSQFLTLPSTTTLLSATAVDEDLDPVTFAWSVVSKPAGANVVLATANAASTAASGMTVAGDYVFSVTVSDPTHTYARTLEVPVFATNQPPRINDLHNRLPVTMTLPATSTTLRGGAPDPEGDAVTLQWTVASAPAGASVVFQTPTAGSCIVDGLTVAGNYVFTLTAQDPTHTVSQDLTVPVYPADAAPVIASATASPATLTLPTASTSLSAVTSDPDATNIAPWRGSNDVITHWWVVKTAPAGATPVFATPGSKTTTVSGLTVAGTYVFTVRAIDRDAMATKDVTVTVGAGSTAPEIDVTRSASPVADGGTDAVTGLTAGSATGVSYTIANIGSAGLTLGSVSLGSLTNCTATVTTAPASSVTAGGSTTLVVTVTPTAGGAWSVPVSFATNDSSENPTNWTMSGTASAATAPEIDLSRSGSPVADGSTDTVTGLVAGSGTGVSYLITNSGTASLTVGTVSIGTLTNCTATVSTAPAASVVAAGTTTLVVTVTPTAAGAWSVPVSFATNDSNENPTNWTMSGTAAAAAAPEIDVSRSGSPVADGSTDTVAGLVAGSGTGVNYLITNSGTASLTVGSVSIGSLTNCTATVTTAPAASVTAAGTTTLVVTVTPTATGSWSAAVSFATNDSNENPTNWTMSGTAGSTPAPEIDVTRSATAIIDGGTDAVSGLVNGAPTVITYQIANSGTAALTVGTVSLGSLLNCTATVTTTPVASVTAGGSSSLAITVTPSATGSWSVGVSFATNDSNEDPTDWIISGTATAAPVPEIDVQRSGTPVADGGTDSVTGLVVGSPSSLTYQIANIGTAGLTVGTVAFGSFTNCTATVATAPSGTVAASGSTTLSISVTPIAAGAWSVGVSFATNDANENPTDWTINGSATSTPQPPGSRPPSSGNSGRSCGVGFGVALIACAMMFLGGSRGRSFR